MNILFKSVEDESVPELSLSLPLATCGMMASCKASPSSLTGINLSSTPIKITFNA